MTWIDAELALTALAAMLSPTTLTFSTLVLVLGERPFRTGLWFYLGALGATLAIGVAAAFVIGDIAASSTSEPKTWVAILDLVLATAILVWVARLSRRPPNPARQEAMLEKMRAVASAPIVAVVGAGATLANPGGFIPIALKDISETNPTAGGYVVQWLFFTLVSLLPLLIALVLLLVAPQWTQEKLERARVWLERRARTIAFAIVILLALSLLRNGIAGLTA